MTPGRRPLNIALLTYRGNPFSGGQGVYVRYLSEALVEAGHRVTVFSGQPYPDLGNGVALRKLPSLDLYRADDPFRTPRRSEFRDGIDVLEYAVMCTAAFPEPLTFSLRAARALARGPFDIVHDNQSLGYGLLRLLREGTPVVATVHHPCSIDLRLELAHTSDPKKRLSLRRWYGFTKMQGRVARRLPALMTVSDAARTDVVREFGVDVRKVKVIHNGVDTDLFKPASVDRSIPGRIVTTASADVPLKGLLFLIEALAKLRTEREADLVVIGKAAEGGAVANAIERFGLEGSIRFESGIAWDRIVELYQKAQVAVVPSLYEGFSLPAIEAMATGTALVASTGGALPEVVGRDGESARLVPPGDAGALAAAIGDLLDDPSQRRAIGERGRERVLERFTWAAAAEATVECYEEAIARC
ncbi:MAG: glycosyltransferase family 4 protein [Actinomycetota bacterium]